MGVLHGAFFKGGMALANPDAILPVFLSNFTASKVAIGLFSSLMGSLWQHSLCPAADGRGQQVRE